MSLGIVVAFGYGILVLVGGIIGYLQAKSKVSLLSGEISGLLIIVAALCQLHGLTWGLTLATLITGILVVFFAFTLDSLSLILNSPEGSQVYLITRFSSLNNSLTL